MKFSKPDFMPLIFVVGYVLLGLGLSIYGPIEYFEYDYFPVVVYMIAFCVLFTGGYFLAFVGEDSLIEVKNSQRSSYLSVALWLKLSISLTFIIYFSNFCLGLYEGSLNLSISKMGEAYVDTYAGYERGTGNVSTAFLVQTVTYIPYLFALILGSFYFKELTFSYKVQVVLIYVLVFFLETVGHGKQKQFGDMLIFLLIIMLLKTDLLNWKKRKKIIRRILLWGALGASGLMTVLFFRYLALDISSDNINEVVHPLMFYDLDHPVFSLFGLVLGFPVAVFTGYFSQGYYGLSLVMQEPFEWTYFVGNSYSLTVFLDRFLGVPVDFHDTYPYRLAVHSEWGDTKWSTAFAWFAGDFTFVGTLFVFMLVAYLYARTWREAFRYKNPISIVIFSMLTIAMLYIPANNQLLHTPGSVMALFFFVGLWLLRHKRFNFKEKINEG